LGANPHPAQALEEFTPREELLPTLEAILRTFDHYGNRDNKLRARMKWLVDTMGVDELRERILKERRFLRAATTWAGGIPDVVKEQGDAPAGVSTVVDPSPMGWGTQVNFIHRDPYGRWEDANVVRGVAKGTVSAYAYARLGDVTSEQFRALASIQREVGGVRVNISGCTNSCGQHHVADIGFVGVERRAHGKPAPGYQMLLGGRIGQTEVQFGAKALRLPAKATAEATVRVVGRFANERAAGEEFGQWLERVGGAGTLGL